MYLLLNLPVDTVKMINKIKDIKANIFNLCLFKTKKIIKNTENKSFSEIDLSPVTNIEIKKIKNKIIDKFFFHRNKICLL